MFHSATLFHCLVCVQVADEHGLEVSFNLPAASAAQLPQQAAKVSAGPEADLTQRLAELRGK